VMYNRVKKNQVNKSKTQHTIQQKQSKMICLQQKHINLKNLELMGPDNMVSGKKIGNNILSNNTYIITENPYQDQDQIREFVRKEMENFNDIENTRNVNVIINNLSVNTCLMCDITKQSVTIQGTYQSNNIRVHGLKGNIELNGIKIGEPSNNEIYGQISIYNAENGTIFNGMIHTDNGIIGYILSNRPLIQIKTPFNGIISLFIKMRI
jgi:hypothetical protein